MNTSAEADAVYGAGYGQVLDPWLIHPAMREGQQAGVRLRLG